MKRKFWVFWGAISTTRPILAATESELSKSVSSSLDFSDTLRWSIGLLFVIAAIFACAFLLRKLPGFSSQAAGVLRILGGVSLGNRERAVLLQVGERQLLLGVSPGSVRTLWVIEQGSDTTDRSQQNRPDTGVSFKGQLENAIQGKKQ